MYVLYVCYNQFKMNNILFFSLIFIGVVIILRQTSASLKQFFLGIGVCLLLQFILVTFYCVLKLHKAYRNSTRINLKHNENLNPQEDYKFQQSTPNMGFFLNKYTQQARVARVFKKKDTLKFSSLDQYYFQQASINEQSRAETIRFLQQIKGYYKILNLFNNTLVDFGQNLAKLPRSLIFNKYKFSTIEVNYPSRIQNEDIFEVQKKIMNEFTKRKYIYKPISPNSDNTEDNYVQLPSWQNFLKSLEFIGNEFKKVQQMRDSNAQMLEMIHQRLLQDYEFIENQIIQLGKSIQFIRENVEKLKKQRQKYQTDQNIVPEGPHIDMIYWLKKQYYQFTDLQLRIKQNQSKFKEQTQKLKYYKERLSGFLKQNKKKYLKILKTRFIAFLDSYFITVDQSTICLKQILQIQHKHTYLKPPKVHKMPLCKQLNSIIQSQITYNKQYSERVLFHLEKLKSIWQCLQSKSKFLQQLKKVFEALDDNLMQCLSYEDKQLQYFRRFSKSLKIESKRMLLEIVLLLQVNNKVQVWNNTNLNKISSNIQLNLGKAQKLLEQINVQAGPMQHKYQIVRTQLQGIYKILQQQIAYVNSFQAHYLKHSNRTKKILLVSFMSFLNFQKKYLNLGRLNEKISIDYDINQEKNMFEENKNIQIQYHEVQIQDHPNLHVGYMPIQYIKLFNKFIFAAYSQWRTSSFFKQTICQQLYIMFNLQPNEGLKQIEVGELLMGGFPPQIVWIRQLISEDAQCLIDIHIAYKGTLSLGIKTKYKLLGMNVPIQLIFQVQQFYCVMRLCFVNSDKGQGWFSFIGQPVAKFNVLPTIGNYKVDFNTVKRMLENIVLKKMRETTYPIRQKLPIPLSIKNNDLEIIKKRLIAQDRQL